MSIFRWVRIYDSVFEVFAYCGGHSHFQLHPLAIPEPFTRLEINSAKWSNNFHQEFHFHSNLPILFLRCILPNRQPPKWSPCNVNEPIQCHIIPDIWNIYHKNSKLINWTSAKIKKITIKTSINPQTQYAHKLSIDFNHVLCFWIHSESSTWNQVSWRTNPDQTSKRHEFGSCTHIYVPTLCF